MNLLAIYPTAAKVTDVLKRRSRHGAVLGERVMTFPQLVDSLWRESADPRIGLTPIGEQIALREALRLPDIRRSAFAAVNPDRLMAVIRQLKSAGLEPNDLLEARATANVNWHDRISDLMSLLGAYNGVLERRNLADGHDRERSILAKLHQMESGAPRARLLEGVDSLMVAEIYDFSLLQFMIISSLIRIVGDASLTIQAQPYQIDAGRFASLTWNRFVEEESISNQVLPEFVRREGRSGRLGFVLENLFVENTPPSPPPDSTLEIVEAPTRYHEVEETARAIRRALEQAGSDPISPARIAVIASDIGIYRDHIESIFGRYRIPFNLHHLRAPLATGPAKAMMQILRAPLGDYHREALQNLIDSPYISSGAKAYRLLLRSIGYIDHNTRTLEDCAAARVNALQLEGGDSNHRTVERIEAGARAIGRLISTLQRLNRPGTIAEHITRLTEVMKRLSFDPSPRETAYEAAGSLAHALTELASSAGLVDSGERIELQEFAEILESVLRQPAYTDSSAAADSAVQVASVMDARGLDFDLVFILGIADGEFPRYRGEDPILPDALKTGINPSLARSLRTRLGPLAPTRFGSILRTRQQDNALDWFLFFLAVSVPERRLVLSFPAADNKGASIARSPFVTEVTRLLGGSPEESVRLVAKTDADNNIDDCFTPADFRNYGARRMILDQPWSAHLADREIAASINQRITIERQRQNYFVRPARESAPEGTPDPIKLDLANEYSGRVSGGARLKELLLADSTGATRRWSPSALNELAACGFKYFAHRVLGLRDEDEPDYELSALEEGDLVHRILRDLLNELIDFSDSSSALSDAHRFLEQYREALRFGRDSDFSSVAWDKAVRVVEEVLEFEVWRRASLVPSPEIKLEHPISFLLSDGRAVGPEQKIDLEIAGRLDRLELYRAPDGQIHRLALIDYKNSRNSSDYRKRGNPHGDEFGRTDFQLAVYLMGALGEFRRELATDAEIEAGYWALRHRDKPHLHPIPRELLETDLERRRQALAGGSAPIADRIISLVALATEGNFDVDPARCDSFCPYRSVCRYPHGVNP